MFCILFCTLFLVTLFDVFACCCHRRD